MMLVIGQRLRDEANVVLMGKKGASKKKKQEGPTPRSPWPKWTRSQSHQFVQAIYRLF